MQHVEMLFRFIGGLGMFLYGMNVMAGRNPRAIK